MIAWTNLRWLLLSAAVASADLGLKRLMERLLADVSIEVLPVFNLALGYNRGGSFGMLADLGGWQRWPLILLALVIAVGLVVWLTRQPASGETTSKSALALVIGGAVGNAVDRMAYGHVTDFILLHWGGWAWPTFNLADVAISLGAILLVASTNRRASA